GSTSAYRRIIKSPIFAFWIASAQTPTSECFNEVDCPRAGNPNCAQQNVDAASMQKLNLHAAKAGGV
ncbi:MAG TPA: hypothetical protein VF251_01805, partial [Pyrinomonadaceae bacterium]